jgi:hypothetical protein
MKKIFGLMIHRMHQRKKLLRHGDARRPEGDTGNSVEDTGREIQEKSRKIQRSFVRMVDILKTKIKNKQTFDAS